MKVLHVSDHLPGYHHLWGGAEQVAYRYINLLSTGVTDKDKVNVVAGCTKPLKDIKENFRWVRIRVSEDFFPKSLQIFVTGLKNRIFSFDPFSFFHLLFILKKEKPDIVHFHKFNEISFGAILATRLMGIKTILGMYDYWYLCPGGMLIDQKRNLCRKFHGRWCQDCDAVSDFRFLLPVLSSLRRPFFDFFLNKIDAYAVLSKSLGKLLVEYGIPEKKIFLVRQVFDFNKTYNLQPTTYNTSSKNEKSILFIGWLDPRKGPDMAIRIFEKVLNSIPSAKLNMIGEALDKNYEKKIREMIESKKLSGKVSLLGKLPHEKVVEYYQNSKVVLLPEQWENMSPVVLVEAMAYGKPVVASKIGGLPEFIRNGKSGFLVERDDYKKFAQKVALLLKNERLVEVMGRKAQEEIVRICDAGNIIKSLNKMYTRLVHNV